MRESAFDKSRRYLTEGRLVVVEVSASTVQARIRGEGSIYRTGYDHGHWVCDCAALTVQCAHIRALKTVTALDLPNHPPDERNTNP